LGALKNGKAEFLCNFDECDFVWTGCLVLFFGFVIIENRSDIVAESKSSDDLFKTCLFASDTGANFVIIKHHLPDLILVFISKLHLIFNGNSLKNHLILGQCSSLIRQNIPDSSQFFGDCGVSGNASFDQFIVVNVI
jgi:hypothetical protein